MSHWIEYVLMALFGLTGLWLMPKIAFVKAAGLSSNTIRVLLSIKLLVGLIFAWYVFQPESLNDYRLFYTEGIKEYHLLLTHPTQYWYAFQLDAQHYGWARFFDVDKSFWANLSFNLIYKFLGLLNLITLGNFYTNTLLFSFFTFFGHVSLYRAFSGFYKEHTWVVLAACFLLPSTLIYTACVHKDGFVFVALAAIVYVLASLERPAVRNHWKQYGLLFACLLTIGLFRNFVWLMLLPALLAWLISGFVRKKPMAIFMGTYTLAGVIFFSSMYGPNPLNLPESVVQRKQAFELLSKGKTNIELNDLQPTLTSFLHNLPQALNHAILRPYVWEYASWSVGMAGLEVMGYVLIFVLWVFLHRKGMSLNSRLILFGLFLFLGMMLVIGYTIPNIGAIVRYRSIFWAFAICPLVGSMDWKRMRTLFTRT